MVLHSVGIALELGILEPQPPTAIANAQLLALGYFPESRVGDALCVEVAGPDHILVECRVVEHGAEAEGERLGQGAAIIGGGGPIAVMGISVSRCRRSEWGLVRGGDVVELVDDEKAGTGTRSWVGQGAGIVTENRWLSTNWCDTSRATMKP